jgi:hypothetical protein
MFREIDRQDAEAVKGREKAPTWPFPSFLGVPGALAVHRCAATSRTVAFSCSAGRGISPTDHRIIS